MQAKTSETHPLEIGWIAPGAGWGRIGMTLCPGKKQKGAVSGNWDRDLTADLDDIRNWGARHVVSVITAEELSGLGVQNIGSACAERGINWHQINIPDGGLTDTASEKGWQEVSKMLMSALSRGESVLIHGKGGLGRTGMLASRLLVQHGMEPYLAIGKVREACPGAIETEQQEKAVHLAAVPGGLFAGGPAEIGTWSRASKPSLLDRFRGCMLGGAVGDALGAPVEFMSLDEIRTRFGHGGVRDFAGAYGRIGAISDDTQMTMFTAEGCIRSWTRFLDRGLSSPEGVLRYADGRWLLTQGDQPDWDREIFESFGKSGWLFDVEALHSPRSPGGTCLNALRQGSPIEDSKGCGGVMRVAPIGLLEATRSFNGSAFELGSDAARITHGHPSGYLAGGAMAEIVHQVDTGASVSDACKSVLELLMTVPESWEVTEALITALEAAEEAGPDPEVVASLGQGWVAEEALAIAVYAALAAETFEEAVVLATNHGGDSDSTGSIAGQIVGALDGVQAIPRGWLRQLELRNEIEQLATDIHGLSNYGSGIDLAPDFTRRYPPN